MKKNLMVCELCAKNEGDVRASAKLVEPAGLYMCDRHRDEYHAQSKEFAGFISVKKSIYDDYKISISAKDYREMVRQMRGLSAITIPIDAIKNTKTRLSLPDGQKLYVVEIRGLSLCVCGGKSSNNHKYISSVIDEGGITGSASEITYDAGSCGRMPEWLKKKMKDVECQKS